MVIFLICSIGTSIAYITVGGLARSLAYQFEKSSFIKIPPSAFMELFMQVGTKSELKCSESGWLSTNEKMEL